MKKLIIGIVLAVLSLGSLSVVVADYTSPMDHSDGIPATQGVLILCDDIGSNNTNPHVGVAPDEDCIDIDIDPCDLDLDIEDDELNRNILPRTISYSVPALEASFLSEIRGDEGIIIPLDCDDDDDKVPEEPADTDGDGVIDAEDNCVLSPNADQKDSFGKESGDACEETYRSDNNLVYGFFGTDGVALYGFCTEDGCRFIANALVDDFATIMASEAFEDAGNYAPELAGGKVLNMETVSPESMTVLFVVGADEDGNPIYQLNVYLLNRQQNEDGELDILPVLVEDDINFFVAPDGTWTWSDKNPN